MGLALPWGSTEPWGQRKMAMGQPCWSNAPLFVLFITRDKGLGDLMEEQGRETGDLEI